MKLQAFNAFIPFQVDDIIQPEGYNNKFRVKDILFIHQVRNNKTEVFFELQDTELDFTMKFEYKDHKWNMVKECEENESREVCMS